MDTYPPRGRVVGTTQYDASFATQLTPGSDDPETHPPIAVPTSRYVAPLSNRPTMSTPPESMPYDFSRLNTSYQFSSDISGPVVPAQFRLPHSARNTSLRPA